MIQYEGNAETIHFTNWWLHSGESAEAIEEARALAKRFGRDSEDLVDCIADAMAETLNDVRIELFSRFQVYGGCPDEFVVSEDFAIGDRDLNLALMLFDSALAAIDVRQAARLAITEQDWPKSKEVAITEYDRQSKAKAAFYRLFNPSDN